MASSSQVFGGSDVDFSAALLPKPTYLLVLHDFQARSPDELTLKKGERVELLLDDAEFGDGWYLGRSLTTNQRGLFPEVYTTSIIVQDNKPVQAQSTNKPATQEDSIQQGVHRSASNAGSEVASSPTTMPPTAGASGVSYTSPLVVEKTPKGSATGSSSDRASTMTGEAGSAAKPNPHRQGKVSTSVVEDTLSDIEEAISEISARNKLIKTHNQRQSQVPEEQQPQQFNDSGSEYSRQDDIVNSDSEIDDDEPSGMFGTSQLGYTADDVRKWNPVDVAEYLRVKGVSQGTCDKFEEQEVTGEILLQLTLPDLKELELGSFGKRFEAWKHIEQLQEELQPLPKSRGSNSVRVSAASKETSPRPRSSTVGGGILPRITSQHNRPASRQAAPKHQINVQEANNYRPSTATQPPGTATTFIDQTPMSAMFESPRSAPESPDRTQSRTQSRSQSRNQSRQFSASNRDSAQLPSPSVALQSALAAGTAVLAAGGTKPHQRESSFDRNWKLSTANLPNSPSTSTGQRIGSSSTTADSAFTGDSGFSGSAKEKSYFSSGESSAKGRKVLQKKSSQGLAHQRKTSYTEEQRVRAGTALSRHSRIGSTETVRGGRSESPSSTYSTGTMGFPGNGKHRRKSNSFSDSYLLDQAPPMPGQGKRGTNDSGFGSMSPLPTSTSEKIGMNKELPSPITPTSANEHSHTKSNASSGSKDKDQTDSHVHKPSSASELRKKSKKHNTSAWKEGLRNITPLEAAREADFSGWMQKRGSGNIATWKPRFFVLNGARLSYFYSESDTKERGLIDVTSHKVLLATNDRLVNIHASLAAATSPSTSPASTATSPHFFRNLDSPTGTNGEISPKRSPLGPTTPLSPVETDTEKGAKDKEHKERGWFTFKLVPPAPGASRGVTFTPPRLHYFATDTKETGRAWMAAIMKATIEIDSSAPVTTSYSAATISLAKARALRARPPEIALIKLAPSSNGGSSTNGSASNKDLGLAIQGLDIEEQDNTGDADVEENADVPSSRSASRADSHITMRSVVQTYQKPGQNAPGKISSVRSTNRNQSGKGNFLLSGPEPTRGMGSGSLRSPSLEKLLSVEEVRALTENDGGISA